MRDFLNRCLWSFNLAGLTVLALIPILLLSACGATPGFAPPGMTSAAIKGAICGAPVDIVYLDGKDRQSFYAKCRTPDGGELTLETRESSGIEAILATQQSQQAITLELLRRLPQTRASPQVVP